MRNIEAYDLQLFAINTGSFYQKHLELARQENNSRAWFDHTAEVVELYRKQCHERSALAPASMRAEVAKHLQEYYAQHLKEMDA